ncbi:MAG: glycosyltransferase [Pirellulales bacterium]
MPAPQVTVAIVPRERFSYAKTSLDSILATTTGDYELLYVDGNSPPAVRDYLACQAAAHSFRVVRSEEYLSPNQARNLAVQHARTKYIVFIDNDVLVSPGWLEALVECAEATGAWVVGPVYCERLPSATWIHMAGGDAHFVERHGRREIEECHRHHGERLDRAREHLRRGPTEQIEFHCALARRDVFDRLGPLDERLWSAAEHTDLCLMVREAGGQVYFEPNSVVTYVPPPPFEPSDREYFKLRWSDAWNSASLAHFRAKWQLGADDPALNFLAGWLDRHRRRSWHHVHRAAQLLGRTGARWLEQKVLAPLERWANRRRFPHVLSYRVKTAQAGLPSQSVRPAQAAAAAAAPQYAQTNLQLYNQMLAAGRSEEDLRLVHDAYELAMRLFAGHYRGNGKPFLAHLVGVASILAAQNAAVDTIVAGLLHSVYMFGEFGDGTRGITPRKRHRVREAAGDVAERIVTEYTTTHWNTATLADLKDRSARLSLLESRVLEIKLADTLEDHLDHGLAYSPLKSLVKDAANQNWTRELILTGQAAGFEQLARALDQTIQAGCPRVPGCLASPHGESYVMAPLSHRERITSMVARRFSRGLGRARRAA